MAINIIIKCRVQRWASPRHYTVDPRLLPPGNPFKYHVETLSLKPMKQYIIATMLDVVWSHI